MLSSLQMLYFLGEYCTPCVCLRYMHDSTFAGLNTMQMKEEVEEFRQRIDSILAEISELGSLCKFVEYDGRSDSNNKHYYQSSFHTISDFPY